MLNESDVKEIRSRYSFGKNSYIKLGNEYGVSQNCIANIVKYKTWKHI